jgi:hypothetical protein
MLEPPGKRLRRATQFRVLELLGSFQSLLVGKALGLDQALAQEQELQAFWFRLALFFGEAD